MFHNSFRWNDCFPTISDKAVAARNAVMEFLLINHPLDCPICDEAGECKLQDYAYSHSAGERRFVEEKVHKSKRVCLAPWLCLMLKDVSPVHDVSVL